MYWLSRLQRLRPNQSLQKGVSQWYCQVFGVEEEICGKSKGPLTFDAAD
jgi:hypothetical protein